MAVYVVLPIEKKKTHWLLLNVHYARRLPPMSYAFGLYSVTKSGKKLKGVVTYGMPPSPTLCTGVCGKEWKSKVLELNRLCLVDNEKNEASRLVGASLKMLPQPTIVVSYADSAQQHTGFIYQATNFLYTGETGNHLDYGLHSNPKAHNKAISNTVPNGKNKIQRLRELHGDDLYVKQRSKKHRYVFLVGNKTQKKELRKALNYKVFPYPKEAVKHK